MPSSLPLLLLLSAAPAPTPAPAPVVAPPADAEKFRRLVLVNSYAVNWSVLTPVPSGEVAIFLGSSLRPRKRWRGGGVWTTALGYEGTLSVGGADLSAAFLSFAGDYGALYHRHHLAAVGHGARDGRLYYAFGGGVLLHRTSVTALEADVKLGCVLGRTTRIKGIVGAQVRVVGVLDGVPVPQFGLFAGWTLF